MNLADLINGCFELAGGLFVLNHVRVLLKDKSVKGVSILSTIVFTLWGVWNLYYYPSLNQMISFYGGLLIVFANSLYISLMLYYRKFPGGKKWDYWYDFDDFDRL